MNNKASPEFRRHYHQLPEEVQRLARRNYNLLRKDLRHPSLRLKKAGRFWSVRVGLHYRALAIEHDQNLVWFWIGPHAAYDRLLGQG